MVKSRVAVSVTESTVVRTPPVASGTVRAAGAAALVGLLTTLVCAHVIVFSQTLAYYGDEGFDLLSAQLIVAGKKPYLDFFYQHPAFYAYATATWMRLFGDGWRGLHLFSALFTCGSIAVSALYVHSRWHRASSPWRAAAVIILLLLIDGQRQIVAFGTVSQAYGACLFFCVCAFYLATTAQRRKTSVWVFGSGLCAGAAAASSLLTFPVVPIILLWLLWHAERSARLRWLVSYSAGLAVPFLPMAWLFARAPRQVVFDTVAYHLFYRHQVWSYHLDLMALQSLASPQALLLAGLGLIGFMFVAGQGRSETPYRDELLLAGALAGGLAGFAAITRPTFDQYFVMSFPFAAILAPIGVRAVSTRLLTTWQRPAVAVIGVVPLLLPAARTVHQLIAAAYRPWVGLEAIGRHVDRVTPPGGWILANDLVYVAAHRFPRPGLENDFSADLPPEAAARTGLNAPSQAQVEQWFHDRRFDTFAVCPTASSSYAPWLLEIYRQHTKMPYDSLSRACEIFWDPRR